MLKDAVVNGHDMTMQRVTIGGDDKGWREEDKIDDSRAVLETVEHCKWREWNEKALQQFIQIQCDRCMRQCVYLGLL